MKTTKAQLAHRAKQHSIAMQKAHAPKTRTHRGARQHPKYFGFHCDADTYEWIMANGGSAWAREVMAAARDSLP